MNSKISAPQSPGDTVKVSVQVDVPVADAFEIFTLEIDQWWRRGPAYRVAGRELGVLHLEPRLGGRLFEAHGPGGSALHEIGQITHWDPPRHFAFEWRAINFAAGERTSVEVSFEANAGGTRVTLEHRGWSSIRPDHPARHGRPSPAFIRDFGMWWGALLTSLREHCEQRPGVTL
jgi:uncharacterized protein YndB with AHSA1/START domain